jgi:hypothetical protein
MPMGVWTAHAWVPAAPDEVLTLLTDPDAIGHWSPIAFDLPDYDGGRLSAGECIRVRGRLLGRTLEFDVDVDEAHGGRVGLTATGPIRLDVEYLMRALDCGTEVTATVAVSGSGLRGRVLAQATEALLAGGALAGAVNRIGRELRPAVAA